MATPTNLWEYFQGQGQTLPTVQQRRETYGLGADYTGTGEQNTALLQKLMSGNALPSSTVPQDSSVITSENTALTEETPFTPNPSPPQVAGNFETPEIKMTPEEERAQKETDLLIQLNESLSGESAFRTEQENAQGITDKTKIVNDLTNQLTTLKNEYDQIPLMTQNQAEGRGITAGGLAPITASKQREIAIRSLGVSALLQAANGNLTTAQMLVDRAVAAKYDPIREQIRIKTANAELILNSPKATIEDKNRAQKVIDAQNARTKAVDDAEAMAKEIWNITTTAAQNTANFKPTAKYPSATLALQAIQTAKTKEEALQIAVETGFLTPAQSTSTTSDITEYNLAVKQGFKGTLMDWQKQQANLKNIVPKTTSETRDTEVSTYLQNNKGTDGYVSAVTYQEALRKFIASGGTQSNFIASFPQQTYLGQWEIDKLPVSLRPQTTVTKADLTPDQLGIINDAKAAIDQVKQRYGDWNATRSQIIEQVKREDGFDISPYI